MAFGIALLWVSPLIAATKIGFFVHKEGAFHAASTALSLFPGKMGSYLRVAYYWGILRKMSADASIGFGSFFSQRNAVVESNVYIGAYCIIGQAEIGDDVFIASRVSIPSGKHQHGDVSTSDIEKTANRYDKVTIGARTWIGEGAIVLANVGGDCVIAAGCVVNKPVMNHAFAYGNPATIKERKLFSAVEKQIRRV